MTDESTWRRCSTCKQPIHFKAGYFTCSVSTCSRKGTDFAFCSVNCWDAHLPTLRHREAWAEEQTAPSAQEWARQQQQESARPSTPSLSTRREAPASFARERPAAAPAPRAPSSPPADPTAPRSSTQGAATASPERSLAQSSDIPREILVVVSKLKNYVRARSGMNTSDEVMETLSDRLRTLCDRAIAHAREDGRKTVMSRDFSNLL